MVGLSGKKAKIVADGPWASDGGVVAVRRIDIDFLHLFLINSSSYT